MKTKIKQAYNFLGEEYYNSRKNRSGTSYFYNELLEVPTTIRMLGNIKNKKILDLGCGPGIYIEKLKGKCKEIKGIDISEKEVKIAKSNNPEIEIALGDVEKLSYKNNWFDIVFASLVMGHLKSWDKVLNEVKRVLKKRGIFVFSIYNPVTESSVKKKWFFKKFRVIENYFEEKWNFRVWKETKEVKAEGAHHHKTYNTIVKLLVKNGFEIIDYEDCKPIAESRELFPRLYEKTINSPHFCVWEIKKK